MGVSRHAGPSREISAVIEVRQYLRRSCQCLVIAGEPRAHSSWLTISGRQLPVADGMCSSVTSGVFCLPRY